MMMIAAALAIHVAIDLGPSKASASRKAPVVTCHKGPVSYKFVGTPGTKFVYGGGFWMIPLDRSIEIIADSKGFGYVPARQQLTVDGRPGDALRTRTIHVP